MRERKRPESNKNREPKVEAFTKLTFLNKHIRVGKWEFKGTNSVLGHFSQSLRRLCESFRNQTKPCVQYSPKRDRKFKKNMIIHINSSSCTRKCGNVLVKAIVPQIFRFKARAINSQT